MNGTDPRAVNGRCSNCGRHLETIGADATCGRCVLRGCVLRGQWQAIASGLHPTQVAAERELLSRRLRAEFEV